ncbi:hypothetical protein GCM10025790_21800 [Nesterenkonia rhizosphaerae]|uniref:Uncharacterized protein n=1 Tax=Nesterenkonia rhizosphaerae TaxID=1348272 RepID=A0ABP9G187_9MICC
MAKIRRGSDTTNSISSATPRKPTRTAQRQPSSLPDGRLRTQATQTAEGFADAKPTAVCQARHEPG